MTAVFLRLVNLSITAGWLVLAILLVRLCFRKLPKAAACGLWGLAALRLVLPFSLQSVLSLIPSRETIPATVLTDAVPHIESGVPFFNNRVNDYFVQRAAQTAAPAVAPAPPGLTVTGVLSVVWLVGLCAMLLYAILSTVLLRRRARASIRLRGGIFLCDEIRTPFVFGVIRPRIYLPSSLPEAQMPLVLAHEEAHLARRDHLWKPLGFLLLSVYWFHPLLWVAFFLFCRDLELACDARVARRMPSLDRAAYSQALLDCGSGRRLYLTMPLAFGEVGIRQRVRAVLSYKKPTLWVLIGAIVLSSVLAVCFLTDPKERSTDPADSRVTVREVGGSSKSVSLDVKALTFGPNGLTLLAEWVNEAVSPVVFGEAFEVYRVLEQTDGKVSETLCETVQALSRPQNAGVVQPQGRAEKEYRLSAYDCRRPGVYRFVMPYQFENTGDQTTWGDGQVFVAFEVNEADPAGEQPLLLDVTCESEDIRFRVKSLYYDNDDVRAPLKAQVEWLSRSDRSILVPASFSVIRISESGREELECSEGYAFPETPAELKPHGKRTATIPLGEAYPCTLPGTYECRLWSQFSDSLLLSSQAGQTASFVYRVEETAATALKPTRLGAEQSEVRLLPAQVSLDGGILTTQILFVNHDDRQIEAHEAQWILRRENGTFVPAAAKETAEHRLLFFTLDRHASKAYSYSPTAAFDCARPGDYRFQVHYRFADDPAGTFPRVMWFDYTIPADAAPYHPSENAPVQVTESACALEGVHLRLADYDLTSDGLTLTLVCQNVGEDVMLRGDVSVAVDLGGFSLGRATKTDQHWHRLKTMESEQFTVFIGANEYSAVVPTGIGCLTGETFDMQPLLQSGVLQLSLNCRRPGKAQPRHSATLRLLLQADRPAQLPFRAIETGDCGSSDARLSVGDPHVSVGEKNVYFSMQVLNGTDGDFTLGPDFSLYDNQTNTRIPLSDDHESRVYRAITLEPDSGTHMSGRIPAKDLFDLPAGVYRTEQTLTTADGTRVRAWLVFDLLPDTLRLQVRNAAYMDETAERVLSQELLRHAGGSGPAPGTGQQTAVFVCCGKDETGDGVTYYLAAETSSTVGDAAGVSGDLVAVTLQRSTMNLFCSATGFRVMGKGHETDGSVMPASVYQTIAADDTIPRLLQRARNELEENARGAAARATPQKLRSVAD